MDEASPKSLGWIKLYRSSIDSRVFGNAEIWKLWTLCLLKANHSENWVNLEGVSDPIHIRAGEFVTGRFALHRDYYRGSGGKSPKTVWRWLEKLENWECLSIKSTNKYSLVTILNYDLYQNSEFTRPSNVQQLSKTRPTDAQQVSTNKNKNNANNDESVYSRKDILELFKAYGYPKKEGLAFFDHYSARGWKAKGDPIEKVRPLIRNWMRKSEKFKNEKNNYRANAEAYQEG